MTILSEVITKTVFSDKKAIKFENGWTFTREFNHFQKVNNKVYVYVTPIIGGFKVQMYLRKDIGMCSLEAQIHSDMSGLVAPLIYSNKLSKDVGYDELHEVLLNADLSDIELIFQVGEYWLSKYGDDISTISEDLFYPFSGFWNANLLRENAEKYLDAQK